MNQRIYLDYAATTPVDPEVRRTMEPYFSEKFGNPGSLHSFGQEAIAAVDAAREVLLRALGVSPNAGFRELVFTGSATEANNLALRGAVKSFREFHAGAESGLVPEILVSTIEHESVLETARDLAREGLTRVIFVPVNREGMVDEKKIKDLLTKNTAIVSVMYANNEIGTVQPMKAIAGVIKEFREEGAHFPLFHTDAAQAFQFLDCNVREFDVDFMTLSAHKVYGPKGIGALYMKGFGQGKTVGLLRPLITGGGQEFGMRSGTENVASIVGFAKAVALTTAVREAERERIATLAAHFWRGIKKICPDAELNGPAIDRLPNILNIYFPGREAQDLLTAFDLHGLAASSGSACRSRAVESSYVIEALGHAKARAKASIRVSFGRPTTQEEIDAALAIVAETISAPASYTKK